MYHVKFSSAAMVPYKPQGGGEQVGSVGVLDGSVMRNAGPANFGGSGKHRLRWTSDLHDRFVDAITQLGGLDSAYFFSILTLFITHSVYKKKRMKTKYCQPVKS
ncbi:hypothetical protein PIB30_064163 [Stylosanthes scabra]|uniref:Uncharacterized protein n=1 Tax=Stylosanthes scabra TaxID=79078 RepID=A0ABU6WJV9_9FABA|nr:hypothetical protein [Stylosanthes scabra]